MIRFTSIDPPPAATDDAQALRIREVAKRWDKLSSADIATLATRDDLIGMVTNRHGVPKTQARKDVDAALSSSGS